ncbi:TPA: hypothetical protein ACGMT3_000580 [Streptococcus agalactiae]
MVLALKSISLFYTAFSPCSVTVTGLLGLLCELQSHLDFLAPHNPSDSQVPCQL